MGTKLTAICSKNRNSTEADTTEIKPNMDSVTNKLQLKVTVQAILGHIAPKDIQVNLKTLGMAAVK